MQAHHKYLQYNYTVSQAKRFLTMWVLFICKQVIMSTSKPIPDGVLMRMRGIINDVITNAKLDFCTIHRIPTKCYFYF